MMSCGVRCIVRTKWIELNRSHHTYLEKSPFRICVGRFTDFECARLEFIFFVRCVMLTAPSFNHFIYFPNMRARADQNNVAFACWECVCRFEYRLVVRFVVCECLLATIRWLSLMFIWNQEGKQCTFFCSLLLIQSFSTFLWRAIFFCDFWNFCIVLKLDFCDMSFLLSHSLNVFSSF